MKYNQKGAELSSSMDIFCLLMLSSKDLGVLILMLFRQQHMNLCSATSLIFTVLVSAMLVVYIVFHSDWAAYTLMLLWFFDAFPLLICSIDI